MSELEIVLYPDPILRENCDPITEVNDEIRSLLDDMVETMYAAPGIGLAAPQIGKKIRATVIDVGDDPEGGTAGNLYKLINPEIVSSSGKESGEEGCLSIPGIQESVSRATEITVKALDENGKEIVIEATGLLAICLQHEIDHLNGVLFIDHLSKVRRQLVNSKLKKLAKSKK